MSLPSCLTLRTVKGSVLSWVELDNNFICLNNSINNVASLIHNGNMWHIPSGNTVTIETDYQYFIYGDMIIEGTLQLSGGSQLVVLNGDLIFSGGTVVGDGDIYNISLPEFDTKISGLTYSGDTLTIYQNDGSTYSTTIVSSTDITVTGGTYNPTTGTATFYDNNGGNFDVNGFLTGYTDVKVSGLTYSGDTLTLTQTDGSNFNVTINSSTPFTGNTSGDCITDLYVTNLYGCSPINVNDSLIMTTGTSISSSNGTAKIELDSGGPENLFISTNYNGLNGPNYIFMGADTSTSEITINSGNMEINTNYGGFYSYTKDYVLIDSDYSIENRVFMPNSGAQIKWTMYPNSDTTPGQKGIFFLSNSGSYNESGEYINLGVDGNQFSETYQTGYLHLGSKTGTKLEHHYLVIILHYILMIGKLQ